MESVKTQFESLLLLLLVLLLLLLLLMLLRKNNVKSVKFWVLQLSTPLYRSPLRQTAWHFFFRRSLSEMILLLPWHERNRV